jgi:predicted Co/Zn/Cd cation transporter (cation efflux family)
MQCLGALLPWNWQAAYHVVHDSGLAVSNAMIDTDVVRKEQSALTVSKWGNLFMGAAGVVAAWLSNSQALLVDGLFSLIGFAAAVLGARVAAQASRRPDHRRPLGYAVDESIFVTFRALSLLGLVAFAVAAAAMNIVTYATGGTIPTLRYGPIVVYFIIIFATCIGLALAHRSAWQATGRRSEVLRLEMQAALFDSMITLAAGVGLSIMPLLKDGSLGWLSPIGDSVIVIILCGMVVGRYYADFMRGLAELAGVSAAPDLVARARRSIRPIINEAGGALVDFSILKVGRNLQAQIYYDPGAPITAAEIDALTRRIDGALSAALERGESVVIVSQHGRVLGPATSAACEKAST